MVNFKDDDKFKTPKPFQFVQPNGMVQQRNMHKTSPKKKPINQSSSNNSLKIQNELSEQVKKKSELSDFEHLKVLG